MIQRFFLLLVIFASISSFSQRGQRIGYVDMEYILENIPEYAQAQSQLDQKAIKWKQNLDKIKGEIETMKADLSNEKALLTEDLITERLEDIVIKEDEFKELEQAYFSSKGDLFLYRKLLVKPIQDKVYNAAQQIGKSRKYDIIFDKSSDVIMIYTNKKADISELVLKSILRTEKATEASEKRNKKKEAPVLSEEAQKAKDEREAKKEEALSKSEKARTDREKKREEKKAKIKKDREERLKKREEVRNQLRKNKEEKSEDNKDEENNDNE